MSAKDRLATDIAGDRCIEIVCRLKVDVFLEQVSSDHCGDRSRVGLSVLESTDHDVHESIQEVRSPLHSKGLTPRCFCNGNTKRPPESHQAVRKNGVKIMLLALGGGLLFKTCGDCSC